ncbi:helix-turn-helix DNA binding domain protein [Arthrobacter phage BarretLemon]|uniref:Helix-turn-helix DNA binding domain protein n=1 Tax=Arthrobacter phage BarretLemon TaxID=1796994 RepID=A0A140G765_9CAUD|nr:HTH DNA binding protein [Arthrobacter phage BarretLemon]AMM44500.1 helix-turn-helix DNA binding domain protein [Arthrobacter phage BarretLemon]
MSTEIPAGEPLQDVAERLNTAALGVVESREKLIARVVEAKTVHRMTNVEIAKHVGLTEGAVRAILKKALEA